MQQNIDRGLVDIVWALPFHVLMAKKNESGDRPPMAVELWAVAEALALTPQNNYFWVREKGGRQIRIRWVAPLLMAAGALLAIGAILLMSLSAGEWVVLLVPAVLLMVFGCLTGLSVASFRRVNLGIRPIRRWFFVVCLSLAVVLMLAQVAFALFYVRYFGSNDGFVSLDIIVAFSLIVILMHSFIMFGSYAVPPLLTADRRAPSHYVVNAQKFWAYGLVVSMVTIPIVFTVAASMINPGEGGYWTGTIGIAAALLVATIVWNRWSTEKLESRRERLVQALTNANLALCSPSNRVEIIRTLRALKLEVWPSSFRTHSIAVPPTHVGWEITQIVQLLLWAAGDEKGYPSSLRKREELVQEHGAVFKQLRIIADHPWQILELGIDFTKECHDQLFEFTQAPEPAD